MMNKKQFLLCKKLFGRIKRHQLLKEDVLHNFFAFYQTFLIMQEQLKTIQQIEKKKICTWEFALCC